MAVAYGCHWCFAVEVACDGNVITDKYVILYTFVMFYTFI